MKWILPLLVLLLVACDSRKTEVSQPAPVQETGPSEFIQRVQDRTVSLLDWKNASRQDQILFTRTYTKLHLGRMDNKKQKDMTDFIVYTLGNIEESTKGQGWSQATTEKYLSGIKLFGTCKAGARVMGWPSPKSKI